jgi:hypothetical protein
LRLLALIEQVQVVERILRHLAADRSGQFRWA